MEWRPCSRMVGVSASVNLPLHHKVQKFSSGSGSPGWCPGIRAVKRLWYMWWWFDVVPRENVRKLLIKSERFTAACPNTLVVPRWGNPSPIPVVVAPAVSIPFFTPVGYCIGLLFSAQCISWCLELGQLTLMSRTTCFILSLTCLLMWCLCSLHVLRVIHALLVSCGWFVLNRWLLFLIIFYSPANARQTKQYYIQNQRKNYR